jgi:putative flippase GtrA
VPAAQPVHRRLSRTWQVLLKELSAFGVVGGACFLLDVGLFQLLYTQLDAGVVLAKLVATLVSMTVAYFGHRHWSFSHRARTGLRREYLLFVVVNGVTLLQGLAIVSLVRYPLGQESVLVLQAANVGSIALGTVVRFLAYRRWVFPAHGAPAGADPMASARAPAADPDPVTSHGG